MDILRLRPIMSHVRLKLSCDNYRHLKILTCVVLLGRLNTMRGISAGEYDKGNMSRGNIYFHPLYIYCLCLEFPCYNQNHHQLFRHFIFAFKICFDQIFVVEIFLGASFQQEMQLWSGCFFQNLRHAFSYVAAFMITASWQKAFHYFKSLPIHSKITL